MARPLSTPTAELPPRPRYVQLEPVGQCNLRCQICPIQFRTDGPPHGPPAYLPYDDFKRLVDQFSGAEELHLQGLGEPMMHPRFFDMVEYAVARGFRVSTNTNLTLLTASRAERCVTSGLDWMRVSVDGATAGTYERIRVRARFERVMANLRRLRDAKARAGSDRPSLHLVMVLMRQNLAELPALVALAAEMGVSDLFVQHLCHDFGEEGLPEKYAPMRDFVNEQSLLGESEARVQSLFEKARRKAESLGVTLRLPRIRPRQHAPGTPGRSRCDWPWRRAYVSYSGDAMPCCMVATPDRANLGNMLRDGAKTVWEGPAYREFRRRLDSGDPPSVCRSCSVYLGVF